MRTRRGYAEGREEEIIVRRGDVASLLGQLSLHLLQKGRIGEETEGSDYCAKGDEVRIMLIFDKNFHPQIRM